MSQATLVIMAAGMGSRFGGGIKQLAPVGPNGEIIMEYSIYDAMEAGFDKVVFVIRKDLEEEFKKVIGNRIEKQVEVTYAYQELKDIPEQYQDKFAERKKPWGTGQAILCCKEVVDSPFLVINADDYYGTHAFKMAYDFLAQAQEDTVPAQYMMVGYRLENTLTDNGYVSRGVCETDADGYLADINERTHIEKRDGGAAYTEDDGKTWTSLPGDTPVSMNMWGFTGGFMKELVNRFPVFLQKNIPENPLKCEYFLPFVVDELLKEKKATVKVLTTQDKWYGVTYKEDKPVVVAAIQKLKDQGLYPQGLWD